MSMKKNDPVVGPSKPRLLGILGPGLITGASDDDPSGIATYSQAGAQFGFGQTWTPIPLRGSWFTHAFEGPMSNLQRFVAGEDARLVSPVQDTIRTMALIEACYQSSDRGGVPVPTVRS